MAALVADFILERLTGWGIHRIYGYPGDGINAFLGAFDRADGDPEFIQARHEEMAAFMACGHGKFTAEIGVCIATSGPGAIHLLNGLYDAKLDHVPVLAIVGQQNQMALGAAYQQEVDLQTLFKDVSTYVETCATAAQARHLIDRGIRTALDQRGVATSVPYAEWLPEAGQARGVEIDHDARMIGIRYPADVQLIGDAKETLKALLPLLERKDDRGWREEIEANVADWWRILEDTSHEEMEPMNPSRVLWELS